MKEKRAAEIAGKLNDTKKWRSHSRGLSMDVIDKELNLMIENFGAEPELNSRVRAYYRLLQDYLVGRRETAVLHSSRTFHSF